MHPQLIPERHPMCGKYMEELVKCREANPVRRFFGECNDITYKLTKCLNEEKAIARAPRQAKYKETWAAKREADAARMRQLEAEAAARNAAQVKASDASRPGSSPSSPSPSSDGAAFAESTMSSGEGSSGPAPRVQAASIYEPSQARAGAVPLSSPLQSDITCLRSCLPPYVPGACSCLPGPLQCLPSSANDLQPACPPPDPVQTRESPREQAGTLSTRTAHDMKSGCRQSGQSNQGSEHAWLEKSGQTRREGSVL